MDDLVRIVKCDADRHTGGVQPDDGPGKLRNEPLVTREWLVTNGLGGYASGTIAGVSTRRYHGLLIAALPSPLGRTMMLNHLSERVRLHDRITIAGLGGEERGDVLDLQGAPHLHEFRVEQGLPVWRYHVGNVVIEKRLFMPHGQNTVHINYRLLDGEGSIRLNLRPSVHFRSHDASVNDPLEKPYRFTADADRYELSTEGQTPPLRLRLHGQEGAFTLHGKRVNDVRYRLEASRGYDHKGDLFSPGYFRVELTEEHDATLIASTEAWATIDAHDPEKARDAELQRRRSLIEHAHPAVRHGLGAELVLAADQFIIAPASRVQDSTRAHAIGDPARTVAAGYYRFRDRGRDALLSL
ncbi:MAG: hypothetical protein NVSMB1_25870 [Polyangiales bacterium]